jgi:hypothetical protein
VGFALTGVDATLVRSGPESYSLEAEPGAFAFTGGDANLRRNVVPIANGSAVRKRVAPFEPPRPLEPVAPTPKVPAPEPVAYSLTARTGVLQLTGSAAALTPRLTTPATLAPARADVASSPVVVHHVLTAARGQFLCASGEAALTQSRSVVAAGASVALRGAETRMRSARRLRAESATLKLATWRAELEATIRNPDSPSPPSPDITDDDAIALAVAYYLLEVA